MCLLQICISVQSLYRYLHYYIKLKKNTSQYIMIKQIQRNYKFYLFSLSLNYHYFVMQKSETSKRMVMIRIIIVHYYFSDNCFSLFFFHCYNSLLYTTINA